jgi:predicted metal-dependent phosphoesterase TrpH
MVADNAAEEIRGPSTRERLHLEVDLHIHSTHSPDSLSKPSKIVRRARGLGLSAIAVTDHDSWEGCREAKRVADDSPLIVPGAELKTDKGDLLALFVEEEISSRDWRNAIEETREKGGIAIVPHPFESKKLTYEDIKLADGVEVFNARCSPRSNAQARVIASELGLPGIASSDAHVVASIGNGRTSVPGFSTLDELKRLILTHQSVSKEETTNPILRYGNAGLCFGLKGIWRRL